MFSNIIHSSRFTHHITKTTDSITAEQWHAKNRFVLYFDEILYKRQLVQTKGIIIEYAVEGEGVGLQNTTAPLLAEVVVLIGGTATDILGLGATDIDILKQDRGLGLGDSHGLGSSDLLGNVVAGLLVNLLQLLLAGDLPVDNSLFESGNGVVGRTHALNFLTGAVRRAGVRHGVATVAVGDVLEDQRTLVSLSPFLAVLDSSLDSEDVHAVDLQTRNVLSTLVVVGQGGGAGSRGTHTVLVV